MVWDIYIIRNLVLEQLRDKIPKFTNTFGNFMAESGAVCFESSEHQNGTKLAVHVSFEDENFDVEYNVYWQCVTEQMLHSHGDPEVATEYGAYGVAILLILSLTDYTVIERSRKGTGFDFWLAKKDDILFQKAARLEVSGILNGDSNTIKARINAKLNQVRRSDDLGLPAYIVVVEFSSPLSQVIQR